MDHPAPYMWGLGDNLEDLKIPHWSSLWMPFSQMTRPHLDTNHVRIDFGTVLESREDRKHMFDNIGANWGTSCAHNQVDVEEMAQIGQPVGLHGHLS